MLIRGRWLAWLFVFPRLMGLKRWGISLLGVLGVLAIASTDLAWPWRVGLSWIWLSSVLTALPIFPATIRFRIGPPLTPEALFSSDDEDLRGALRRTEASVQALVRASRAG